VGKSGETTPKEPLKILGGFFMPDSLVLLDHVQMDQIQILGLGINFTKSV